MIRRDSLRARRPVADLPAMASDDELVRWGRSLSARTRLRPRFAPAEGTESVPLRLVDGRGADAAPPAPPVLRIHARRADARPRIRIRRRSA